MAQKEKPKETLLGRFILCSITLTKYDYAEWIGMLPFAHTPQ